jgi:hypothetical protein
MVRCEPFDLGQGLVTSPPKKKEEETHHRSECVSGLGCRYGRWKSVMSRSVTFIHAQGSSLLVYELLEEA